jgi:hypothetical protein
VTALGANLRHAALAAHDQFLVTHQAAPEAGAAANIPILTSAC